MAFMLNEEEHTPYGTPVLARINRAGTADEIVSAVEQLNRQAGGGAFVWIMGEQRPVGLVSASMCRDGLVLNATPEGGMPPPVQAKHFTLGIKTETKGNGQAAVFVKFQDGEVKKISSARLEKIDDGEDPLYIVTLEPGEKANVRAAKNAEVDAPRNSEDFQAAVSRLAAASNRPGLAKEPLLCHIPSVRNKYIQQDELADAAGTMCVVDVVRKKGNHLELDLMSVQPDEIEGLQVNPGDQSAEAVANGCSRFGKGLPLFFIYSGKPYAASCFETDDGMPPMLTLEPWADVDEDDGSEEIRMLAAKQMADGLI